ncbi:mycothiol synthase [Corynebacterium sp. 335C]
MTDQHHDVLDGLGDGGAAAARRLLDAAAAADGVEPFGEAFLRGLDDDGAGHRHLRVEAGGELAGIAASDGESAELAVHPDHRRTGIGRALLDVLGRADSGDGDGSGEGEAPAVWAHGDLPAARALSESAGWTVVRELLQMSVGGDDLAEAARRRPAPEGIRLETLPELEERIGADAAAEAWLTVNNEAFDWHPEQGGWTPEQLRRARDVDWFDPAGVLFAVDAADGDVVGFHWTKRHPDGVGEVYVIGLADRARGRGAGSWLTREGIAHLAEGGAREVILYVEGDNEPAVGTYRRTGFGVSRRDVMRRRG